MIRPFEADVRALVPTPELLSTIKNGTLKVRRDSELKVSDSLLHFMSLEIGKVALLTLHGLKWINLQQSRNEAKQEYEYVFLP